MITPEPATVLTEISVTDSSAVTVEGRAKRSLGTSGDAIYRMVAAALDDVEAGGTLVDIGCGQGRLHGFVSSRFRRYVGVDVVRYDGFPATGEFHLLDLDSGRSPLPEGSADVVVAVETIEHLENPRALMRELTRVARPGGWVVVTTPNQGSLLSLSSLVLKGHFNAFLGDSYPAHITALVELDLLRMVQECRLVDPRVRFSLDGRIPGTSRALPRVLARINPRRLSNTILVMGRKP